MKSNLRWIGLAVLTVVAWLALGYRIPSPSERVYLLVPPILAVAMILRQPIGLKRQPKQIIELAILAIAVFLVSATYGMQVPGSTGAYWTNLKRALASGEVFFAAYFLFALILIILCIRALLFQSVRRLFVPRDPGLWRLVFVDLLAFSILLAIAVPFAISAIFVHRFKVPNGQTPASWARPFETVDFQASDGVRLHGWFVPAQHFSPRTVIFCHGIGANSAAFLGYLQTLDKLKTNVFFLDLRGHGESDGHTVTMGGREKLDVVAAAQLVRQRWPEQSKQLFGLGVSMGSSALVLAAAELNPPFDAIIIDSGFAAATDLADKVLGQFPAFIRPAMSAVGIPMASLEADCDLRCVRPVDAIGAASCRVLIVHATGDGLIPLTQAKRMYEKASEPKKLWIADLVQHGGVLMNAPQDCFDFVLGDGAGALEAKKTQ